MTNFPYTPALHRCDNRGRQRVYALCGDLKYPDGTIVPRGFKTDGASRPWLFRKFLKCFGKGFSAFILHDFRYAVRILPRHLADKELFHLLTDGNPVKADRHSKLSAWVIYQSVKTFGWIAWKNNTKRNLYYFYCPDSELNNPNHDY